MSLASVDLLAAIEPVRTTLLGRFRRLAVNDSGARLGVPSDLPA